MWENSMEVMIAMLPENDEFWLATLNFLKYRSGVKIDPKNEIVMPELPETDA